MQRRKNQRAQFLSSLSYTPKRRKVKEKEPTDCIVSCGISLCWRITSRVQLRVFILLWSSIQMGTGQGADMGQNSGAEEKLFPESLPEDIRRWVGDGLRAVPQGLVSSCVFEWSQGILPSLRSAVAQPLPTSKVSRVPWQSLAPMAIKDQIRHILYLSIYLKPCLCEMGIPFKCKHHLGSLAYEPSSERPKTNFYLTWMLT